MADHSSIAEGLPPRRLPARWYLMRAVDRLARLWPPPRRRRGVVVVIADSGLGDVMLARAAIARYPDALGVAPGDITIVGTRPAESLAPLIFPGMAFRRIDEIAFHRRPLYRLRFALWLRRRGFAVAICGSYMRKPMVCDALIALSGATRRIVVQPYITAKTRRMFEAYLRSGCEVVAGGEYPTAEILRHGQMLSAVARREVPVAPSLLSWRSTRGAGLPPRYAIVAAGASAAEKCWPLGNFLTIAAALAARGFAVLFIGGTTDRALKRALAAVDPGRRYLDRIGDTTLLELFDVLAQAALVVANDTGPAHIAAALGRPTIVILGGGHFGANFPYPPEAAPPGLRVLYRAMPCYHCNWRCTQPHPPGAAVPCIAAITAADVLAAVDDCLAATA